MYSMEARYSVCTHDEVPVPRVPEDIPGIPSRHHISAPHGTTVRHKRPGLREMELPVGADVGRTRCWTVDPDHRQQGRRWDLLLAFSCVCFFGQLAEKFSLVCL